MMVDTTVYGYINDGGVSCTECWDLDDATTGESVGRIYSTDDTDSGGLSCDGCGKYIFEPDYRAVWQEAIQDLLTYGRMHSDSDWRTAERILLMFEDEGFDAGGKYPDR